MFRLRRVGCAERPHARLRSTGIGAGRHHGAHARRQASITDGPFAETKEQLAGFYLVEASDLNEAIQLAGHIPAARVGCVVVLPVRELQV